MDAYTEADLTKAVLLTIDMQQDFVLPGAPGEVAGTAEVVSVLAKLVAACRQAKLPVIHVIRLYAADGSNADNCRRTRVASGGPLVRPHSPGAALVPALLPQGAAAFDYAALLAGQMQQLAPLQWLMYKPRWGAFFQTPLEAFLRSRGCNTVIVAGCNFPNCPRTTLYEASERDFRIVMVEDALSGLYPRGIAELGSIGATVITGAALTGRLGALKLP